jgi:DNA-directed RNA polymerase specialized sigma24 family protein
MAPDRRGGRPLAAAGMEEVNINPDAEGPGLSLPSAAAAEIFRRVRPRLAAIIAAHGIPAGDADDLVQDSLVALLAQWAAIRSPEDYIAGIVRRKCALFIRQRCRERRVLRLEPSDLDALGAAGGGGVGGGGETRGGGGGASGMTRVAAAAGVAGGSGLSEPGAVLSRLDLAVLSERLSIQQTCVLTLRWLGYTYSEIGAACGRPTGTVRRDGARALERLQKSS